MDVVQPRKVTENLPEPFRDGLLGELDLAHVKGTDALNFVAGMDDRGGLALGPHQDDVDQIGSRGHGGHLLEVVDGHGGGGGCLLVLCCVVGRLVAKNNTEKGKADTEEEKYFCCCAAGCGRRI